ncbi:MAG TPA: group 1 truncated hemoglobin [Polyangiaceae bacterium]
MEPSLYEELGGELVLRSIIDRFVDRMVTDVMIGFYFRAVDRDRLKAKEFEFAAEHLGAPVAYTGRPVDTAHRPQRIFDGHFMRRLTLLRETLEEFGVPERVRTHWIAHTLALQSRVVAGPCQAPAAR